MSVKPVIVMQPGPVHLFWTTGVFYFWSLKLDFDFVFIVPETYRNNKLFSKIEKLDSVRHVEYLPSKPRVIKHLKYKAIYRGLLKKYNPSYFLLHNRVYPENIYLINCAKVITPTSPRFYYQNGRMSLMWEEDFQALRATQIESLRKKIPLFCVSFLFCGIVIDVINFILYMLFYKVMPFIATGKVFHPILNVYTGRIYKTKSDEYTNGVKNDILLAYDSIEIEAFRAQGINKIQKITHPMHMSGKDVFEYLYGKYTESDTILILPSYGFTSRMIKDGWAADKLIEHISKKWCEAIESLLNKFPGYSLKMKLHPASFNDSIWQNILDVIQKRFPMIEIVDPGQIAEWLVVQSKVVVGDVTTVLWWAALYGGKIVVSFDIFGYPGGGELSKYKNIIYCRNLTEDLDDSILKSETRGKTHNASYGLMEMFPTRQNVME